MRNDTMRFTPLSGACAASYFAGANTADGFRGAYADWIREEECTRLFILKGGSGTGKSSLMKACAAAAPAGCAVTQLLCSSDPASADAVILTHPDGRRAAILDGTAPHTVDPALPGAVGEIVDLGEFWDADALAARREEIAAHAARKADAYRRAYRYLAAEREILRGVRALLDECVLHGKLEAAAARALAGLPSGKGEAETVRITYALSMTGAYHLETLRRQAARVVTVRDVSGAAGFYLSAIRRAAKERGLPVILSPRLPDFEAPGEIWLPTAGVLFTPEAAEAGAERAVNMQRFLDRSALAARRGRIRFGLRCAGEMRAGALAALGEARTHHFALEEIYRAAMDFSGVEAKTEALKARIGEILG